MIYIFFFTYVLDLYEYIYIIGITNTIGRVTSGMIANLKNVDALVVNNVALIIASVVLLLEPFCTVYWALILFAVIFGLCVGMSVKI